MSDISLAFEADQLAIDNKGIIGYDRSASVLAQGEVIQKKAHEVFKKVLESINLQQ